MYSLNSNLLYAIDKLCKSQKHHMIQQYHESNLNKPVKWSIHWNLWHSQWAITHFLNCNLIKKELLHWHIEAKWWLYKWFFSWGWMAEETIYSLELDIYKHSKIKYCFDAIAKRSFQRLNWIKNEQKQNNN